MLKTLQFENTELSIIDHNGLRWLRGPQIGAALGFQGDSSKHVRKLYNRHASEFDDQTSCLVAVPSDNGGVQKTRVFSPRGAALIAMLAKTERAAKFRQWVLDVLEDDGGGDPPPMGQHIVPVSLWEGFVAYLRASHPRLEALTRYVPMGLNNKEIGTLCGVSASTIREDRRQLEAAGVLDPPAYLETARKQYRTNLLPTVVDRLEGKERANANG